ncbi:MAG: DUF488 family protein [Ardenticatenales bacterium]|nr:DUF488 family protein [Ardenticatenales bacterium]
MIPCLYNRLWLAQSDRLHSRPATAAIEFLIDVRSQPYSRHKPDFSKEPLKAISCLTERSATCLWGTS